MRANAQHEGRTAAHAAGAEIRPGPGEARAIAAHLHAFWAAYLGVGGLLIGLIAAILVLNSGTFSYTLDDPYIHLSVSEQIRAGSYGVNPHEASAPSSSILYPFLLAPAARWSVHPYLPLLLNAAALFGTLEIFRRLLLRLGFGADRGSAAIAAVLLAVSAPALNLVGLVLSGMEHSAHVFLSASIVYALIVVLEEGRLATPLALAAVLAPLLRYEALPLSLAALAVLGWRGWWRTALGAVVAIGCTLVGFSAFLVSLGLPPLPSSVLVKSTVAVSGVQGSLLHFGVSMLQNAAEMSRHSIGLLMQLGAVAAALFALRAWRVGGDARRIALALVLVGLVAGHAVAGQFDWFDRYEIYAVVAALMLGLYLAQASIQRSLALPAGRMVVLVGGVALLVVAGGRYLRATALVPIAASNIYEQQYQMHRFIHEFHPAPTCVNDLGWTTYRNDVEILDLWGLGSEQARLLRKSRAGAEAYEQLAREHGADLAILHENVLGRSMPTSWAPLATLTLSRQRVTPAFERVAFYATDPARADALRAELRAFQATLPPDIRFELAP